MKDTNGKIITEEEFMKGIGHGVQPEEIEMNAQENLTLEEIALRQQKAQQPSPQLEEQPWYPKENALYLSKKEECSCAEMTCAKECNRNHTHKGFSH